MKKQKIWAGTWRLYVSMYGNNIRSLRSRGYPFTKQPTLSNTKQKNQQTTQQTYNTELKEVY